MPTPEDSSYLQLISLAVHELRTPAGVVAGYLRMLQQDADQPLSGRQRKMVDEAGRSCQRLTALISELNEIHKLDDQQIELSSQTFDLFPLVADVAGDVHEAGDRDVRLEVRGQEDGAPMRGDVTQMRRAFSAFFRAILREMPASTTVVGERRITNDGAATSAVVIIAAEPSVQASYSAQPVPLDEMRGGLGLALPFARRVIERHGGRVWSPAHDHGRGAAIISLPLGETR
jgi:signal transduction histidine kinase